MEFVDRFTDTATFPHPPLVVADLQTYVWTLRRDPYQMSSGSRTGRSGRCQPGAVSFRLGGCDYPSRPISERGAYRFPGLEIEDRWPLRHNRIAVCVECYGSPVDPITRQSRRQHHRSERCLPPDVPVGGLDSCRSSVEPIIECDARDDVPCRSPMSSASSSVNVTRSSSYPNTRRCRPTPPAEPVRGVFASHGGTCPSNSCLRTRP